MMNPKINKISRQTVQYVPHRILHDTAALSAFTATHHIIALEYTNKSIPYTEFNTDQPILLLLGNEQTGLSDELLAFATTSIHLPMLGINSSMNVAMAAGIGVYGLLKND